jgi:hypothetical protein
MIRKFTVIIAVGVFLIAAANLFADEKGDEGRVPALQKELESRRPGDLQQPPLPAEAARQPAIRRRVMALRNEQLDIDAVQRRNRADQPQPPVRQQAPERLERIAQLQNRWFEALKDAYRDNDMERIGRLIRKMEQFREQTRNRMESAQQIRPLQRQRYRRDDEGYQPQGPMRNFGARGRNRGPVDRAPAFRRQLRQEQRRRFRMQDVPDRQIQRPLAPPAQGYYEKSRQPRAQRQFERPEFEGREPESFGRYEEGIQQRRLRQQRGWQQQRDLPREGIPENEELDFDWDW